MHLPWQGNPSVRRSSHILLPFALLIGLAACGDAPLEPAAVPETNGTPMTDPFGTVNTDLQSGEAVYTCFTSVATPDGPHAYRYGTIELDVPSGLARAADGETARFQYHVVREDGSLVRLANCVLPDSREVREWAAAWFRSGGKGDKPGGASLSVEVQDLAPLMSDEVDEPEPCPWDEEAGAYRCREIIVGGGDDDGGGSGGDDPGWGDDGSGGGEDPCWDCGSGLPDPGDGGGSSPSPGDDDCDPTAVVGGCEEECSHDWYSDCVSISPVEAAELDNVVNEYWINNDERCVKALNDWSHFRDARQGACIIFCSFALSA